MKKVITLFLAGLLVFSFAGCSADGEKTQSPSEPDAVTQVNTDSKTDDTQFSTQAAAYKSSGKSSGKSFETVLNTNEYAMYYNIFYNHEGDAFADKPVIKTGIFATLYDGFSDVMRYYVWGYNDQTKCCDWQWEMKVDNTSDLPSNGSLVEVTGTFTEDANALDGYWITAPKIKVKKSYKSADSQLDMSTMSATLERVEAYYITSKNETLEGQTVTMYGRVLSPTGIQHPYYDGAFEIGVETQDEMPAIGTMVLVSGTIKDGKIVNAAVSPTEDY